MSEARPSRRAAVRWWRSGGRGRDPRGGDARLRERAPEPRFSTPWHGWERYGAILLSGDRGDGRTLGNITVPDELPAAVLQSPAPTGLFD